MKKVLLSLLLLLSACCHQKEWSYREVKSNDSQFHSACLLYQPDNELMGVGIEFLNGIFGTVAYLNVTCRQIPSLPDNPDTAVVVLQIADEKFPYKANRMEGGQRLLLPNEATEQLLASLKEKQAVTIYLDGYMTKLTPSKKVIKFLKL